jgi:hypothetical protein
LAIGDAEQATPPGGDWTAVVQSAAAGDWHTLTARRTDSSEHLVLRFDHEFAMLEHWLSEDGPARGARFLHRQAAADRAVELPCCGCGIPLAVPDGFAIPKGDAVRLFLQFIDSGQLPLELAEPQNAPKQPTLFGMEDMVVPAAVRNAVTWESL